MSTTEVREVNTDADGLPIDWRQNERAGVLGTVLLLEQIARNDSNPEYRHAARHQADFLRALMRRRSRDGRDTLDGAIREALQQLMAPPPTQLQAPVRQLGTGNDSSGVIDV